MQTILAILEVVKTSAAICSTENIPEQNKKSAGNLMLQCISIIEMEMKNISSQQSNEEK